MHHFQKNFRCLFLPLGMLLLCAVTFAQSNSLAQLNKFPEDLSNPLLLEYKGLYEDGWVTESSYLIFQQSRIAALLVRGVVPLIGNPHFSTKVQILVDNRSIFEKQLPVGEFALQTEPIAAAEIRKIELQFSHAQQLPAPDERPVAALIKSIGFVQTSEKMQPDSHGSITSPPSPAATLNDILVSKEGIDLSLGGGWYSLENQKGNLFRWVKNDAQFTIVTPANEYKPSLDIVLEPGPGVGLEPFELQVIQQSNNTIIDKVIVRGRETVRVKLSVEPGKVETYRLHIEGGGRVIQNDLRILNFRVFCITAIPQKETQAAYATPPPAVATYAKKRNGMFEDGWIGKETEFLLPQLQTPAVLSVRGKIIEAENFTNEIRVQINGKEVARKTLKVGDFDLVIPVADGKGVRKVKLFFTKQTKLPNNDQRMVSALLTYIGFEAAPLTAPKQ